MDLTHAQDQLSTLSTAISAWAVAFVPRAGAAIVLVAVGIVLAGWLARAVTAALRRTRRIDATMVPVISSVARYAVLIVVAIAALAQLGVQTTSLLAVLGAAGLAIGLALQGTLSNIAAGIMLLWLRPFSVGDYVEGSGVAGTVLELGLFHTQFTTWDGIFKVIPNSQLWNSSITNYSRNPTRLVLLQFGIAYEDDIAEGRRVLKEMAEAHPNVLKDPPPVVVPLNLGDSAVVLQLRAWAPNPVFWNTQWDLTQNGKKALESAGISIPFPQRVVHMVRPDASPSGGAPEPSEKRGS